MLRLSKQVVFSFYKSEVVSEVRNKERRFSCLGRKKQPKCKLHKITNERGL